MPDRSARSMPARGRLRSTIFPAFERISRRSGVNELPTGSAFPLPRLPPVPHTIRRMNGLMMDFPLTLSTIFRHAEQIFRRREIVSRRADKSIHRYTYARLRGPRPAPRAAPSSTSASRPAIASPRSAGTTASTSRPTSASRSPAASSTRSTSASTPTSSPTSSTTRTTASSSWTKRCCRSGSRCARRSTCRSSIVVGATKPVRRRLPRLRSAARAGAKPAARPAGSRRERRPRPCATRPARRATRRACSTRTARSCCTRSASRSIRHGHQRSATSMLPVVPMFHANAWGLPFAAVMVGAKLVMPGPHLDPASLVDLFERERVTDHRRRADDLDGRPAVPRRESRRVRSVVASARCLSAAPPCRSR